MQRRKINKYILCLILLFAGMLAFPLAEVWAGSINPEESKVIAAASGTFEYKGKKYRAYSTYKDQLYSYLSRDDVDLTADQALHAISYIYHNVKRGIDEGYVYEIEEDTSDTQVTEELGPSVTETTADPKETDKTEDPSPRNTTESVSTEKTTTKTTDKKTEGTSSSTGKSSDTAAEAATEATEEPTSEEATTEISMEELMSGMEKEVDDRNKINERVDPKDAEASAVIEDDSIVIDTDDGEHITLEPSKEIIQRSWTLALEITAIVVCSITVLVCLVLIFTRCMRFRKTDRSKPLHGHRRRHKIRKVCRGFLLVTTGVSIAGFFVLIALFASLFNESRIEQNIQDSGYFRYAYIQYLSDHGKALEGAEFLSDEEATAISETLSTAETNSTETIISYEQFLVKEKQATQQLLLGNRDVEYQKGNVAPYILRIKEDLEYSMLLSGILFLVSLILGCVFSVFMDMRRDRGIRMIAISDIIGTVCTAFLAVYLLIWSPAKKLFIEPDYLYLFFKNYIDWIARAFAVISVFGLVLGMALFGLYMSRHKERSKK